MNRNVEIKARVDSYEETRQIVEKITGQAPIEINQEDIYFNVSGGRIKLRILSPTQGNLIYYNRPNIPGPKTSDYYLVEINNPGDCKALLQAAYGIRSKVKKVRHLYKYGRTRIHLDEVEKLGAFIELEVVLSPDESYEAGEYEANELIGKLGINDSQLISDSYVDIMERQ